MRWTTASEAGPRAAVVDPVEPATACLDDAASVGGAVRPLEPVPTITHGPRPSQDRSNIAKLLGT